MSDFAVARHHMVESQVRPNKVTDASIIGALERVERERFVPDGREGLAYVDEDIVIADGRTMMEPMVIARLLQTLMPHYTDIALVVGCGTGYSAALLAEICTAVVGVESDKHLAEKASNTLTAMHVDNVAIMTGPLHEGFPSQAPYNVVLLDGAVELVPDALLDQLAEGGRLAAVIQETGATVGRATLFTKSGGSVGKRIVFDANIGSLPGREFRREVGFVF